MSQENVELARRCNEVFARRDWSLLPELVDPAVVVDLSRNSFNPNVYRGYDGIRRSVAVSEEMWDDITSNTEGYIDAHPHVVVSVQVSGRTPHTGVEVQMRLFSVWTFRDGRLVRLVGGFRHKDAALYAAGLRE